MLAETLLKHFVPKLPKMSQNIPIFSQKECLNFTNKYKNNLEYKL